MKTFVYKMIFLTLIFTLVSLRDEWKQVRYKSGSKVSRKEGDDNFTSRFFKVQRTLQNMQDNMSVKIAKWKNSTETDGNSYLDLKMENLEKTSYIADPYLEYLEADPYPEIREIYALISKKIEANMYKLQTQTIETQFEKNRRKAKIVFIEYLLFLLIRK